jgi:hypothetical protein
MDTDNIKKLEDQIHNLENVLETTNIVVTIPEESFLTELYTNLKTFSREQLSDFLKNISDNNNINPDNKQFNNMKDEQRKLILERLKEKLNSIEKKVENNTN